ncbi:MAG: transcription elongation factor GreA, partial [Patescibacteria group bacterium]
MTDKQTFITKEGLLRLQAELLELKTHKRRELADRIREAKELGDLSENAEYIQAKEEQAFVEGKIQELEYLLK